MIKACCIARFRWRPGILLALALALSGSHAQLFAQGTLSTILTNGPTTNRVNIVILSEGYTSAQLGQFLVDAASQMNTFFSWMPYQEYRSYFNVFAISVASTNSGSSHPLTGDIRNTYFSSAYDTNTEEVITIPPNYRNTNYSHGQGKVDALLQALLPECDLPILLVNSPQHGGSGATNLTITALNFPPYSDIVVHETGHTFADLADEYDYVTLFNLPKAEKPNSTAQTNRATIKWNSWILPDTLVPTPPDPTNALVVGLFQGAQYQSTGWYRPKLDCKMRTLGVDFCEVCSEALVKSIYQRLRLIDSFLPSTTSFSVVSTQSVAFSVTPLQPMNHSLIVQWHTNGVAVSDATNTLFPFFPNSAGDGTHLVHAVVSDPTTLVRNDPAKLLHATNTWSVNVSINQLSLNDAMLLPDGRFRLTVVGVAPQGFVIQASTNLTTWVSLATNNLSAGRFDHTNASLTNISHRFYRAYAPP